MLRFYRFCAVSILLVCVASQLYSQTTTTSCVNYDSRYPIYSGTRTYFWNPIWNFPTLKEKKVSNINIGGNGMFLGLLEYLPAGYTLAANAAKKYPVIIYFHGGASKGFGSSLELCRLFKDRGGDSVTFKAIPGRIERNTSLFTQTYGGVSYEYIVISPQFTQYTRLQPGVPDKFPSATEVENVINYVVSKYRVDPRRIYLTGFSNGANMIIEYAGSSVARSQRVAAIMPVSLCSQLNHISNTSRGIYAKNIGLAKLKTWFVFCEGDNCGSGPALNVPNAWVDSIRKVPGSYPPRYTRLRNINPASLYNCSDTLLHDAWSRAYDPNFRVSYNFTTSNTLVNDGINLNMWEWFTRQVNPLTSPKPVASRSEVAADAGEPGLQLYRRSLTISPNPFRSDLVAFVSLQRAEKLTLTLTDLSGRQIQTLHALYGPGTNEVRMNAGALPKGIYLLKISGETINVTQKVVKQ